MDTVLLRDPVLIVKVTGEVPKFLIYKILGLFDCLASVYLSSSGFSLG